MPLMNSLWPTTFWASGRQTFFASSFLHAEKTTAKSADGHVAPALGLVRRLTTPVTLLRRPYSKHRRTPGQMFCEHPLRIAVYTNTSPKWASWPLDFPMGVRITNRTHSDLVRPSGHLDCSIQIQIAKHTKFAPCCPELPPCCPHVAPMLPLAGLGPV